MGRRLAPSHNSSKGAIMQNTTTKAAKRLPSRRKGKGFWAKLWAQRALFVMLIPGLVFYLVFRYGPMYGLNIAFKDYSPFLGVDASPWIGIKQFERLFANEDFWQMFWNTLRVGVLSLLIGFPAPIIFALILNEIRKPGVKKVYQTISYLPHFLSVVIVCSVFLDLFSVGGVINKLIVALGGTAINFAMEPEWYDLI